MEKNSKLKISVVIPMYNASKTIERALNSIKEQLQIGSEVFHTLKKILKEKKSIAAIEKWQDPIYAEKCIARGYAYKEYYLPSGRVVKLQGYEPQVLTELLKTYNEEEIAIGIVEIKKEIGKMTYIINNKVHTYFPDFYIKTTNTIIEVKSKWTFELHKEVNLLKEQACLNNGINFKFIII
jgi:hypothetical protein